MKNEMLIHLIYQNIIPMNLKNINIYIITI